MSECLEYLISPDSIFYDRRGWGITFFVGMMTIVFLSIKKTQSYHYTSNGLGRNLSYNRLRQVRSISLQWGTNSGASLKISELRFHWGISLFICVTLFVFVLRNFLYNTPDRILQNDFNAKLNQSFVILISLVSTICQSVWSVSPIYPFLG